MSIILLSLIIFSEQIENMTVRRYGRKHKTGGMFFNSIICLFASVFFLITDKNGLCFKPELFLYSTVGTVATATGFYAAYLAFRYGSYILTRIVGSFSSVITITYGIVFLKEPTDVFSYVGIVSFFICSIMVNLRNYESEHKGNFSLKWLISAILTAVSNAMLGILMRSQQIKFDGLYDNEYMILNLFGAAILLAVIGIVTEPDKIGTIVKKGLLYGAVAGGLNGFKNLITFIIYIYIPLSVFVPVRSGISCILGFLISLVLYKERFTKLQLMGIFFGALSILMFAL